MLQAEASATRNAITLRWLEGSPKEEDKVYSLFQVWRSQMTEEVTAPLGEHMLEELPEVFYENSELPPNREIGAHKSTSRI